MRAAARAGFCGGAAALLALAAHADMQDAVAAAAAQATPQAVEVTMTAQPVVPQPQVLAADALRLPGPAAATQTMAWVRHERVAVGLGVERRWPSSAEVQGAAPRLQPREGSVLFGVSVMPTGNARLSWQKALATPGAAPALIDPAAPAGVDAREPRLALSMQSRDAMKDLRKGLLLKMELSSSATLAVRPRHGRLGLQLSKEW